MVDRIDEMVEFPLPGLEQREQLVKLYFGLLLEGKEAAGGSNPITTQVIPTPSHLLDHISPIFSPFFPVFCAFSPSRRGGSNEPQAGKQGRETVARVSKQQETPLLRSG